MQDAVAEDAVVLVQDAVAEAQPEDAGMWMRLLVKRTLLRRHPWPDRLVPGVFPAVQIIK